MLLIILALLWIILLTPIVVGKVRERRNERSIEIFHAEHEQLARYEYAVEPAYRLDESVPTPRPQPRAPVDGRRPRLTVVHDDDTYGTVESRRSWEEWSDEYDFDRPPRRATPSRRDAPERREARPWREGASVASANRYARAYQSTPRGASVEAVSAPRRRSMRARRRVMATRVVLVAVVLSLAAYVTGVAIVTDLAVLAWLAVVGYVALALFAISQGYLSVSSRPRSRRDASLASVEPLHGRQRPRDRDRYDDEDEDRWGGDGSSGYDGGYEYEPGEINETPWRRRSYARYAIG
jgi:hypothetical protein